MLRIKYDSYYKEFNTNSLLPLTRSSVAHPKKQTPANNSSSDNDAVAV